MTDPRDRSDLIFGLQLAVCVLAASGAIIFLGWVLAPGTLPR